MGFLYDERDSDSPFIDTIMRGRTEGNGITIRPAESCWHMVVVKTGGTVLPLIVGPLTAAGSLVYIEGVELLWIKFKIGTYMPHMPIKDMLNRETTLPGAAGASFWLNGSAWHIPTFENADTFADRLVRANILARDPVIDAALQELPQDIAPRTVRHRFLHTTGLTQNHIRQVERAQRAAALLQSGVSILDAVFEAGYYDQPHLTRSLKQWIGQTPAQLIQMRPPG